MRTKGITHAAKMRAYNVMMAALSEEHRLLNLPREELLKRQREIYECCFGDETPSRPIDRIFPTKGANE